MALKSKRTLGSRINSLIAPFAPGVALQRETALARRQVLLASAHYDGAGKSARAKDFRRNTSDAVEAIRADRGPISYVVRDQLRNNPRVVKARRQLRNNVVGVGILPSVQMSNPDDAETRKTIERLITEHCLTTDFDADGRVSMLGQQSVGFGTIAGDGEVLFRRRFRRPSDGYALNFQVQMLETDYLDENVDGVLSNGNTAIQGIEFDKRWKCVAYWLFDQHPGSRLGGARPRSRRVSADNIIHAFDLERPGQRRGVSWFAPVVTLLHELQKYQDGQVKRQEIAALFAAIYSSHEKGESLDGDFGNLAAGTVMQIGSDESLEFTNPPSVEGYEPFMQATDRVIAACLGLTYEGFTGDYSRVNYTSGRMGRTDTDPGVQYWQRNLMIAGVCAKMGNWIKEGVQDVADIDPSSYSLPWTPPTRPVVDPTKDYKADRDAVDAGQMSRRSVIRRRGEDPVKVEAEIVEERNWEKANEIMFRKPQVVPPTHSNKTKGKADE